MSDKFRTPSKPRFVKTPRTGKSTTKKYEPTRKYPRNFKNIEDETIPVFFGKDDVIATSEGTDESENDIDRPGPSGISDSDGSNPIELSIVAEFDDLIADYDYLIHGNIYKVFLKFADIQANCHSEWDKSNDECRRLQSELDKANHDIGDFTNKLSHARKLLDQERKMRRRAEEERNSFEKQMALARDLLFNDKYKTRLPDETREKLAFLNNTTIRSSLDGNGNGTGAYGCRLNTINEVNSNEMNSTGSLLSDLSYSRSEDDLDTSAIHSGRQWVKHRPAPVVEEPSPPKKRRSSSGKVVEINTSDKIIATTTVSVTKDGPITATSVIESVPQELPTCVGLPSPRRETLKDIRNQNTQDVIEKIWQTSPYTEPHTNNNKFNVRQHTFAPKTVIRPDVCGPCNKRIRFGKIVVRCKDCRGLCHNECKDKLPTPCIPIINTPTQKGAIGTIADYAPTIPPMVPAIIVHCVNEIELRGLNELGIYRVPGSEKDVKMLKERFLRGKGPPMLNEIDVHVICGVVKDFLRSLQEPILTQALWREFISVSEVREIVEVPPILYGAIGKLPQPNRDTLAYMILHLQRVAEAKDCKMPVGNLSKVFGPTIVGYSSQDPDPAVLFTETRQQAVVMEYLLSLPGDYWSGFVNVYTPKTGTMHQTPSTDSLLRHKNNRGGFYTPYTTKSARSIRKPKNFFLTPPHKH